MRELNLLEILGYLASIIVVLSLMMNSIVRLRWFNLIGALLFSIYGIFIKAYPVALLNSFIVVADVYYILQMYNKNEFFKLQQVSSNSEFLKYFLDFYKKDIKNFFPDFNFMLNENMSAYYMLRNAIPAGVVIAEKQNDGYLKVYLDYVIKGFRDLKLGKYFYYQQQNYFKENSIKGFLVHSYTKAHGKYLEKIGFAPVINSENNEVYKLDIA